MKLSTYSDYFFNVFFCVLFFVVVHVIGGRVVGIWPIQVFVGFFFNLTRPLSCLMVEYLIIIKRH